MRAWTFVLLLGPASCGLPPEVPPCPDPGVRSLGEREALQHLRFTGSHLQELGRYSEARECFEAAVAMPIDPTPPRLWSYEMNQKGWAQIGIAECWEAEGRWEEALSAYRDSHLKYPVRGECGNGNLDQRDRELKNIARCIERLERP